MYCIKCGKQNVPEAEFCSFCGAQIAKINPEALPIAPPLTITPPQFIEVKFNYEILAVIYILFFVVMLFYSLTIFIIFLVVQICANFLYNILVNKKIVSPIPTIERIKKHAYFERINFPDLIEKIKGKSHAYSDKMLFSFGQAIDKLRRNIQVTIKKINPRILYSTIGIILLIIASVIFFSSATYENMIYERKINSIIENKNEEAIMAELDKLRDMQDRDESMVNIKTILEKCIPKKLSKLNAQIANYYILGVFTPTIKKKIFETFINYHLPFSDVPILIDKYFSASPDEYLALLKTHPKLEVINTLEKQIITSVNNSDGNSNFQDINEKIYFLRNNFGSSNDSIFSQLGSIYSKLNGLKVGLNHESVAVPVQPTYEKPLYHGVVYLYSEYIGPFEGGGMVLRANGKYYLAKNGSESRNPFVRFYYGYYEKTGETMTLNRGRYGTECEIIEVRDEETFRDDQRAYQNRVENAQETYKTELTEYKDNLVKYGKFAIFEKEAKQQIEQRLLEAKNLLRISQTKPNI